MPEVWDECDLVVELGHQRFDKPVTHHQLIRWHTAACKAYREIGDLRYKLEKLDKQLALPIPCSADEIEITQLERELEQARVDRVVLSYSIKSPSSFAQRWTVSLLFVSGSWNSPTGLGETKLIALRSALEQVREQRAMREAAKAAEAEEKAIAAAKARINAVVDSGKIEKYESKRIETGMCVGWQCYIRANPGYQTPDNDCAVSIGRPAKLEALTAAAEWAESLVAKKPALPAVESMTPTEMVVEIIKRGYEIREGGWCSFPALYKNGKLIGGFGQGLHTLEDTVAHTRKLDGDACR